VSVHKSAILFKVKEGEIFNRRNTLSISRIALKVAPSGLKSRTACQKLNLTPRLGKRAIYGWALISTFAHRTRYEQGPFKGAEITPFSAFFDRINRIDGIRKPLLVARMATILYPVPSAKPSISA
jgi:hypothetical protein